MDLLSFTRSSPLPSLPNPPSPILGRSRSRTSSRIPSPTLCSARSGEFVNVVAVLFGLIEVPTMVLELPFFC